MSQVIHKNVFAWTIQVKSLSLIYNYNYNGVRHRRPPNNQIAYNIYICRLTYIHLVRVRGAPYFTEINKCNRFAWNVDNVQTEKSPILLSSLNSCNAVIAIHQYVWVHIVVLLPNKKIRWNPQHLLWISKINLDNLRKLIILSIQSLQKQFVLVYVNGVKYSKDLQTIWSLYMREPHCLSIHNFYAKLFKSVLWKSLLMICSSHISLKYNGHSPNISRYKCISTIANRFHKTIPQFRIKCTKNIVEYGILKISPPRRWYRQTNLQTSRNTRTITSNALAAVKDCGKLNMKDSFQMGLDGSGNLRAAVRFFFIRFPFAIR